MWLQGETEDAVIRAICKALTCGVGEVPGTILAPRTQSWARLGGEPPSGCSGQFAGAARLSDDHLHVAALG